MFYTILPKMNAAIIYQSKKQLIAANGWVKQMDPDAKHYKTAGGKKAFLSEHDGSGIRVVQARKNDDIFRPWDFLIPMPGHEYLLKGFCY